MRIMNQLPRDGLKREAGMRKSASILLINVKLCELLCRFEPVYTLNIA